ncbi:hypothetical protein L798_13705 [Zootermopsis nevadensis]|uniref:Uncharacterized protein n=1 Tax=Zootermopsis nevadensis TaxID=136037 RepID=A0A067QSG1_ZOONE|nr:hypothetical protein L798_13705 [Zootermopsis nevadensis]
MEARRIRFDLRLALHSPQNVIIPTAFAVNIGSPSSTTLLRFFQWFGHRTLPTEPRNIRLHYTVRMTPSRTWRRYNSVGSYEGKTSVGWFRVTISLGFERDSARPYNGANLFKGVCLVGCITPPLYF